MPGSRQTDPPVGDHGRTTEGEEPGGHSLGRSQNGAIKTREHRPHAGEHKMGRPRTNREPIKGNLLRADVVDGERELEQSPGTAPRTGENPGQPVHALPNMARIDFLYSRACQAYWDREPVAQFLTVAYKAYRQIERIREQQTVTRGTIEECDHLGAKLRLSIGVVCQLAKQEAFPAKLMLPCKEQHEGDEL